MSGLAIVTATTNRGRADACLDSWQAYAEGRIPIVVVENGGASPYLGTVAAFRQGVNTLLALDEPPDVIACLHDDVEITEPHWDRKVLRHFERQPACGLLGFGGAIGLGASEIYQVPYDPMQLARVGFRSNMRDAEAHGVRSLFPERVACLDGFSQIGRRQFWKGAVYQASSQSSTDPLYWPRPWDYLHELGIVHHAYDGVLGCLSRRYGWETWYLPVACQHFGGRTAVGDAGYQHWAATQTADGDQGFWQHAHRQFYDACRDVLPLRV